MQVRGRFTSPRRRGFDYGPVLSAAEGLRDLRSALCLNFPGIKRPERKARQRLKSKGAQRDEPGNQVTRHEVTTHDLRLTPPHRPPTSYTTVSPTRNTSCHRVPS